MYRLLVCPSGGRDLGHTSRFMLAYYYTGNNNNVRERLQIQIGGMDGLEAMDEQTRTTWKWAFTAMPIIMAPLMTTFPSALCLYWTYSNIISLVQGTALKVPAGVPLCQYPFSWGLLQVLTPNVEHFTIRSLDVCYARPLRRALKIHRGAPPACAYYYVCAERAVFD